MTESTWKILKLDWKTPGKLLEFFTSKRVGTLVQIPTCEGTILQVKRGQPRTSPAVGILKVTQQGAATVRCRCRLGVLNGVHFGASW